MTQPSLIDGGSSFRDVIGTVERSVINEYVDCAVSTISTGGRGSYCGIAELYGNRGPGWAQLGDRVYKRGRTTGITYGDVDSVDATIQIEEVGVNRIFRNQISIRRADGVNDSFALPGDSDSVVISSVYQQSIGLLFAGTTGFLDPPGVYAYLNPMFTVLNALEVDICSPPKGKEKDKEREKDEDKINKELMKEKERESNDFLHQKVGIESLLMSDDRTSILTPVDDAQNTGPLQERLTRLEASVEQIRHFISRVNRPEVSNVQDQAPTNLPDSDTSSEQP